MCGRFAFFSSHEAIARLFGVAGAADIEPRWNIAPTQYVPVVRADSEGVRRLAMLYWGLVPSWAKEKSIGARMFNARAETLAEKPAFRAALKSRRCLVLASGYYEWQAPVGGRGPKQPFFIRRPDREPFAFAGLWESWPQEPGEPPLESCTIVTTEASGAIAEIHHRAPAVLEPDGYGLWLDPRQRDTAQVLPLLHASPEGGLVATPVSRRVNDARNEGPDLIDEV